MGKLLCTGLKAAAGHKNSSCEPLLSPDLLSQLDLGILFDFSKLKKQKSKLITKLVAQFCNLSCGPLGVVQMLCAQLCSESLHISKLTLHKMNFKMEFLHYFYLMEKYCRGWSHAFRETLQIIDFNFISQFLSWHFQGLKKKFSMS